MDNERAGLVSIIIPAYNVKSYIQRCLDSVSQQTYPHLEIIVVNDGSTDGTDAIIRTASKLDGRIRMIGQKNAGVSAARNRGLAECHGDYIVWVDADDYIAPDMVAKVVDTFEQSGSDVVVVGYSSFDVHGSRGRTLPPEGLAASQWLKRAIMDKISMVWNFAATREMWKHISFPVDRTHMSEDAAATIDVFKKVKKVSVIPEALYFYNKGNPSALTAQVNTDVYYDQLGDALMREKLCQQYCPEEMAFFLRRILSFGVKSYAFGLHDASFTPEQRQHIREVLAGRDFSKVPGHVQDKFLRWCILHGKDRVCGWYGSYKYKKMVRKKRRK